MTQAQTEGYRAVLKQARWEFKVATDRLEKLRGEISATETEIARLRRTITALAGMCSEDPYVDDLGITDAVREVMRDQLTAIGTTDVMDKLVAIGFDLRTQKNAQASVHAVLQRLAKKGEIERVAVEGRSTRWKGPKYDPKVISDDDIPLVIQVRSDMLMTKDSSRRARIKRL